MCTSSVLIAYLANFDGGIHGFNGKQEVMFCLIMVRPVFFIGAILQVSNIGKRRGIYLKAHAIGVLRAWHETCISANVRTLGDIGRLQFENGKLGFRSQK